MKKMLLVFMCIPVLLIFCKNADAASTHVVYKAGQTQCTTGDYYYNSIQSAVDGAGPGDSIVLCPAGEADPYVENVIGYLSWGNSKLGLGISSYDPDPSRTVVQAADPNQHVFYFAGGGSTAISISGLTIKGATGGTQSSPCQVCLNGNCFDDTQPSCAGIRIYCTQNNFIHNNYLTGNNHGIIIKDTASEWVFTNVISYNHIYSNKVGVKLQFGNYSLMWGNYIHDNTDNGGGIGIHLTDTWNNEVSDNLIENNDTNFNLERVGWDVNENIIYRNEIINSSSDSQVSDNTYPDCLNNWHKRFKPTLTEGNYWDPLPLNQSCYASYVKASRTLRPNLGVYSLSSPSSATRGQNITIVDTTINYLPIPADQASTTAFYLSTDSTYSAGDIYLGSRPVPSLGPIRSDSGNTVVTIPTGTAPGNYYIIAYADINKDVCEADENSNCNPLSWGFNNAKTHTAITVTDAAPWSDPNWQYRQIITIDQTITSANLGDFPLLIKITDQANTVFTNAQADGDDIFFAASDGVTMLDHEIEYYANTGTKELDAWVRIPTLSSTSDTIIYMYYGNSSASNQENPGGVWDSNHVMVQHLSETGGQHIDSTVQGNNSDVVNVTGQGVPGKIGGADEFGADDYINIPDQGVDSPLDLSSGESVTLSAWVYAVGPGENPGNQAGIIDKSEAGSGYTLRVDGWNCTSYGDYTAMGSFPGNWSPVCSGATPNNIRQNGQAGWYHVVYVYDAVTFDQYLYINGIKDAEGNWGSLTSSDTSKDLQIGAWYVSSFDGYIDEVRISNTARSQDWINASFNNQQNAGAYLTFGAEEIN